MVLHQDHRDNKAHDLATSITVTAIATDDFIHDGNSLFTKAKKISEEFEVKDKDLIECVEHFLTQMGMFGA